MAKQKMNTSEPTNGYALSRYNSLNHGVLSRLKVLPWEDAQELEEIQNSFLEEHQPKGATEKYLVLELANIVFRRQRLYQAENALIVNNLKRFSSKYSFSHVGEEVDFLIKDDHYDNFLSQDDEESHAKLKEAIYHNSKAEQVKVLNECDATIQHAQKLIESNLSYEKILSKLDPEVVELWQEYLENDDEESDFTPTKESLIEFLKENVIKYNKDVCASIKAAPYIKQQAIGKSYIPDVQTETLQRYETGLDRRFERLLSTLLKLQDHRKENSLITVNPAVS